MVDQHLRQHVTFKLESPGSWTVGDLASNKILLRSEAEPTPEYITRIRDKLSQRRLVTDIEAEEVGTPCLFPFFVFLVGKGRGNASCTIALLDAVCGTPVWLAIGPIYSLDNSATRSTH